MVHTISPRSFSGFRSLAPLAATLVLSACGAAGEDADGVPTFGGPRSNAAAGAGGSLGPSQSPSSPNPGTGGSGSVTGSSGEGNGGSLSFGAGGSATTSPGNGGSGTAVVGNGGSSGVGGGSMQGTGGTGPSAPAAVGRVGAEDCPAGPFGSPLPATLDIQPLAATDSNNNLIWEGTVWTGDALYFSEITSGSNASQISRYTLAGGYEPGVFQNTGSNGLALDADGNLLLAAHDVGGISRLPLPNGPVSPGAQTRNGERFNSPNDLVLRADGNIYFSDPDFQSPDGRIQGGTRVYRIAPPVGVGAITVVDESLDNPNGVSLSPDGNTLYVSGGNFALREYSLDAAGVPTRIGDIATNLSSPDGMGMDCAGNIYAVQNGPRVISVFSPEGEPLGQIGPNGFDDGLGLTNVAFGGPDRRTLFISSFSQGGRGGLYSVQLNVPGLPY
jgi:gluconolactonase